MAAKILCVNPGSTSTKLALFDGPQELWRENLELDPAELSGFSCLNDQIPLRTQQILDALVAHGTSLEDIDAFSGRGGGQASHEGGTYLVNQLMVDEAHAEKYASHPACLACQICFDLGKRTGAPAFMTNSPATDEMRQIARVLGMKDVYRICYSHALNQKEIAQRYAESIGRAYEGLNLVVCHIGGGISVTAHHHGRMVDTNDILNGDGPMAPTRVGSIPAMDMVNLCYDAQKQGKTRTQMMRYVRGGGGLQELLGTFDAREIRASMDAGDIYAANVYDAMIYQIAKYVGAMSVALTMDVDAIVLTGGIAYDDCLCDGIEHWAGKIAPIVRMPGEFEMEALAHGACQALEHGAKTYTGIPVWEPESLHATREAV